MKKKILALCLVVVLAVTAVTGATLAYFSDAEEVTNTFTVGEIDITLDEAVVEKDGDDYVETDDRTDEGNEYDEIYPGAYLPKDPTVTVLKKSEDSYVRMIVTVGNYSNLATAFPAATYPTFWDGEMFLLEELVEDWDQSAWDCVSAVGGVYEFWYNGSKATDGIVPEDEENDTVLEPLFTGINIPGEMTNTQIAALEAVTIDIDAHAIQSASFADAADAWANW